MMKIINDSYTFLGEVIFSILPTKQAQKFTAGDTTPKVLNNENWICNNTGAITVTNFDNGATCQVIKLLGDGFTTVANNAAIKTNTGANKLLAVNKIYTFHFINGVWYENA